jgi:hypothetical protein
LADKFIQQAIKKPGQLHRDLGIPQDKTVPLDEMKAAAKRGGKVGNRARLALMLRRMPKGSEEAGETTPDKETGPGEGKKKK